MKVRPQQTDEEQPLTPISFNFLPEWNIEVPEFNINIPEWENLPEFNIEDLPEWDILPE